MADSQSICAYKEVRLNLDSTIPASNVVIRLPSPSASSASRSAQKRPYAIEIPPAEDETQFRRRYLATAASIYHRKHHKSPRSFLWRVLDDGKTLTVRAADLCKPKNSSDLSLTLRFLFPSPIRPNCIALADSSAHNVLNVFALTESNHLYTLTLRPDFFKRVANTEENVAEWCKSHLSSAFSFKYPHRLTALSGEEVVVSLHDGGLLKLTQRHGDDGSAWRETFYNAGSWTQGLRSLIPFHSNATVRHGKANLKLSTITSIAPDAISIDEILYLFTVSLDHRLRAWDLDTGKVAYVGDVLGEERQPNEIGRYTIHPSQSQLVRVSKDRYEKVTVVTYSPIGAGQFKFWSASPDVDGTLAMSDLFPDEILAPFPPTSDVWTVNDFWPVLDTDDVRSMGLWLLWKNNVSYRLQRLHIDLDATGDIKKTWASSWESVAPESLHEAPLPAIVQVDPTDITEKWLDFIMYPGRFSTSTLEAALFIYERGLGATKESRLHSSKSLPEKLSSLIASTATLIPGSDGVVDYEQFKRSTDAQWRRFYRLVLELEKQQGEAMSLSFDDEAEMPWIVTADGLAAVRRCNLLEALWFNPDIETTRIEENVNELLTAASAFRESFSDELLYACNTALAVELYTEPSLPHLERIRAFYDRCNLQGEISDSDWNQLAANMGGNFRNITLAVYESLLKTMMTQEHNETNDLPLAEYGRKTVIRGIQEMVALHRTICFDQLVLLVFMQVELDPQDDGFELDAAEVFDQLLSTLKQLELLRWMASKRISPKPDRSTSSKGSVKGKTTDDTTTITVLEGVIGHLLGLDVESGDIVSSLTELLVDVTASNSNFELDIALIQCYLLKEGRSDLALETIKFASQDPFSTYLQGRAYLAAKDAATASILFKKAAFGLDPVKKIPRHSVGFIDDTERNLLNAGLPQCYSHIVSLFDKERHYSYVVEFASLGLQFTGGTESEEVASLKTELHSRLFNAAVQTCNFDVAHSTLSLFSDLALQHAYARTLILKLCETGHASKLMELPFIGLQEVVENVLSQKAHSIVDINVGTPYHTILYSWRIKHHNFRGAAAIMLERLQRLQQLSGSSHTNPLASNPDEFDTPVTRAFLMTINVLSCVDPKQAWILAEGVAAKGASDQPVKRRVVTLDDLRRAYQAELDRIAAIENGQFGLVAGADEMEVDVL